MSVSDAAPGRAVVIGTGLIGGSIGLRLRQLGWHVTGRDADPAAAKLALELGALDAVGDDPDADVTFVATPVGAWPQRNAGKSPPSAVAVCQVVVIPAVPPVPAARPIRVTGRPSITANGVVVSLRFIGSHPPCR